MTAAQCDEFSTFELLIKISIVCLILLPNLPEIATAISEISFKSGLTQAHACEKKSQKEVILRK